MEISSAILPIFILLITFITMSSWALYEAFITFDHLHTNAIMQIQNADKLGSLRWKTWYITAILYSYYENQGNSVNDKILNNTIGFMYEFAEFKEEYDALKFWPNLEPNGNMTEQLNTLINFAKNANSNVVNNDLFERATNNTEYVSSTIKHTKNKFNISYEDLNRDYLILNIIIWASLFTIVTILILTSVYFLISYQRSSNTVVDRVSREKNKFIRYVFHEIRNPLQAVHLGLDQIIAMNSEMKLLLQYLPEEHGLILEKNRDSIIGDMKHATEIMTQLVNDCLDLQQIEHGTFEIYKKHCIMKNIIDKSVAAAKSIADTKTIEILTELANDLYVNVDPIRIQQVITNLLSNAIKFSNINSIVRVSCNEYGLLSIEDYGPGINKDQIKRIFEPFNPEADHHQRGSGLGLSIVKSIVAKHNTTIDLTSRQGHTKFTIKLEICDGKCCKDKEEMEGSIRGKFILPQTKLNILLVEDNIVSQKITSKFLENLNMNVTIASNGQEAVELASTQKFDCILMDKEMPVMDGYESTKTIRSLGNYDIIIGLTGNALKEDIEEFKIQGVNDVLTKPLNVKLFMKTLLKMNIIQNKSRVSFDSEESNLSPNEQGK
jgi:signal transduction histidine kinase/CheY-like chemotaxis protein